MKAFTLRLGTRQKCLCSLFPFKIILVSAIKQQQQQQQQWQQTTAHTDWKGRKQALYSQVIWLSVQTIIRNVKKEILELITECRKTAESIFKYQFYFYILTMKNLILHFKKAQFKIASKTMKYLVKNLWNIHRSCMMKTINHWWKKPRRN